LTDYLKNKLKMKKITNLLFGLLLIITILVISSLASHYITIENNFVPGSVITHSTILILSVAAILYLKKFDFFTFPFRSVKLKHYLYGILLAFAGLIVAAIITSIIVSISGMSLENAGNPHSGIAGKTPLQFFLFVFLYASICEEFLYRGLAQNFFKPLQEIGIRINKNVFISLPVLLCGVLFSMSHLILLTTNTGLITLINVLIMTWIIGTIAGYFQEKHQNILPAIVIHMTANLPGLIISLFM